MMPFSTGTRLERVGIAGPKLELSLGWFVGSRPRTPLQKQETKRVGGGLPVATPMPKSVLSCGRDINCLEGECSAYLSPIGWHGIYSICFSQFDDGKDSFPLDGVFSAFIAITLIRDNKRAVIENYPISLIDEIRFDS